MLSKKQPAYLIKDARRHSACHWLTTGNGRDNRHQRIYFNQSLYRLFGAPLSQWPVGSYRNTWSWACDGPSRCAWWWSTYGFLKMSSSLKVLASQERICYNILHVCKKWAVSSAKRSVGSVVQGFHMGIQLSVIKQAVIKTVPDRDSTLVSKISGLHEHQTDAGWEVAQRGQCWVR